MFKERKTLSIFNQIISVESLTGEEINQKRWRILLKLKGTGPSVCQKNGDKDIKIVHRDVQRLIKLHNLRPKFRPCTHLAKVSSLSAIRGRHHPSVTGSESHWHCGHTRSAHPSPHHWIETDWQISTPQTKEQESNEVKNDFIKGDQKGDNTTRVVKGGLSKTQ